MADTKPAGSLEPINTNRGKWTDNLDGAALGELGALAKDINKAVDNTVKQVARGKIKVGKLLLEARALFTEDQAFGKWRKEETMVQSKQHAHYLMQVAERFGDAPKLIEGANYSVLQELVLADQKEIEWIEAKIDAGEPLPTVVEVREKVNERKGTSKKGMAKTGNTKPLESPHASINLIVQMELHQRIQAVLDRQIKGMEGHLIIIGLDPDPQTPCNPDILEAISDYYESRANDEHYGILLRSIEAVTKDFKNWGQS